MRVRALIGPKSWCLSQVFRSSCGPDFGVVYVALDGFVETLDGVAKYGVSGSEVSKKFAEGRAHESGVATLEPKRDAVASFSDFVAVGSGDTLDQAMQAQATELVG